MTTLWVKFPDEALSSHRFTDGEKEKINAVFSTADPSSPWQQALRLLSLKSTQVSMIKWFEGCPYFNWSEITRLISGNAMTVERTADGQYGTKMHYNLRSLTGLLSAQWKIARFLNNTAPEKPTLPESLALGIALQSLILRLGDSMEKIATSLAAIEDAKPQERKVLEQIQAAQMRRTSISHVWQDYLSAQSPENTVQPLPDFFWDDEMPSLPIKRETLASQDSWKGMPVCAGKINGLAVAIGKNDTASSLADLKKQYNAPLILVFRNARPQTVELFPCADALLFAEGGVLSHACTVAREMNIPAITALGTAFFSQIESNPGTWLTIDGQAGTIEIIKN